MIYFCKLLFLEGDSKKYLFPKTNIPPITQIINSNIVIDIFEF